VIAPTPPFRRAVVEDADVLAELVNYAGDGLSVIVSDANSGARRLYERCGYGERAKRAMIKEDWVNEGRHWVLLTKDCDPQP
jgi:hypothetical protein